MLLVKREESTSFDVFFGVLKREKRVRKPGREQKFRKMCSFFGLRRVPGAIYSLGMHFEAAALGGLLTAFQGPSASKVI